MGKKQRKSELEHEIDAVLAGQASTARRLIELIHAINPTACGFAPAEMERRYGLKAGLQSVLVRRYRDELAVVAEDDPAVAMLRHRFLGRDACHVRVAELDDEARSWAQLQLDAWSDAAPVVTPSPAPTVAPQPEASPDGGALERARAALEAYDYEAAHELLSAAVVEEEGTGDAPLLLLELLVDTLAFDAEALEAERAFAPETLESPEVWLLLAVAAARLGRRGRAEELLAGLDSPRVAEVWSLLAANALRAGEEREAESLLEKAEAVAPGAPQAAQLRAELTRRREERLRPMSENLARLFAAGELEAAERLARELLAQSSEHRQAGRVLRAIESQHRARLAQQRRDECERALAAQELPLATTLLAQAAELGADPGDLPARLSALQAEARERARRERMEAVEALFAAGDQERGVGAWLELEAGERAEVRERVRFEPLAWLEELGAPGSAGRARPLVEAVLTFDAVRREPPDDRPEQLEAKLLLQEKLLKELKPYRLFLAAVRERVAEKQRAEGAWLVQECRAALAQAKQDEALALLARIEAMPASHVASEQLEALRAEASRLAELQTLVSLASCRTGAVGLLGARDAAARLARVDGEAAREDWLARCDELTGQIQREFRVRAEEVDEGLEIADLGKTVSNHGALGQWLDDSGSVLCLVSAFGQWVFVREIDVAASRVRRQVSLRVPEQAGAVSWQVDAATLWIGLQSGWLLELDRKGWLVLGFHRAADSALCRADRMVVAPRSRTLFLSLLDSPKPTVRISDLDCRRRQRSFSDKVVLQVVCGSEEVPVAGFIGDRGFRLFDASGASVDGRLARTPHRVLAVAAHPCGEGLVALATAPYGSGRLPFKCQWLLEGKDGAYPVEDGLSVSPLFMATSREAQCCFALITPREQRRELIAWGWRDGKPQQLYRVEAPLDVNLVADVGSRRVVARYGCRSEQRLVLLTGQAPVFELGDSYEMVKAEPSAGFDPCSLTAKLLEDTPDISPRLRGLSRSVLRKWTLRQVEMSLSRAAELMALAAMLERAKVYEFAAMVAARGYAEHPADALMALCHAENLQRAGEFEQMRDVLERVDWQTQLSEFLAHYFHLLGNARLALGDRAGAVEAWREGAERDPGEHCGLHASAVMIEDLQSPVQERAGTSDLMARIRNGLIVADACLAAGDMAGAVGALELDCVVGAREVQCLARLAFAWLSIEPDGPAARLRKTVALAAFVSVCDRRTLIPGVAGAFPNSWDEERQRDLAIRAATWLEEHG